MSQTSNPVVETLAQELHRQCRAADKALSPKFLLDGVPQNKHDHGWAHCGAQKYFRKRAALLIKRAHVKNPETLGEAEMILATTVLLRRLSVQGQLVVPVPVAYAKPREIKPNMTADPCRHCKHDQHVIGDCLERVVDAAGDVDWCPCTATP